MTRLIGLALLAVIIVLPACHGSQSGHVVGTGTIHPSYAECRAWFVRADSGREYQLTQLAEDLQQNGVRVRFILQVRNDLASTCMVGAIADVVSMTKF